MHKTRSDNKLFFYSITLSTLLLLAGCTFTIQPEPTPASSPLPPATSEAQEDAQAEATAIAQVTAGIPMSTPPSPTEPPERVELAAGTPSTEITSLMPSGPGINQYVIAAEEGQSLAVDVTSDGVPLSLTIESPSGNRWIPEMMTAPEGYTIGIQLTVPETGDYLITLGKADHTPSTNFTVTFTLRSVPTPEAAPVTPTAEVTPTTELTPTAGQVQANEGITIAYESFGSPEDEAIVLIAGTGMSLTGWPIELIEELVARGYHVIRFDNRDIGLSTRHTEAGLPDEEAIEAAFEAGEEPPMPYNLRDMAADTVGLMDALGIDQTHIAGISMGGAIAQLVAIDYPERILSLTSIAADSGNPELPVIAKPEAFEGVPPQPATADREAYIEWQVKTWQALAGPVYPTDEETLRAYAEQSFERDFDPEALIRQQTVSFLGHIESSHYRLNNLENITVPTVVLQGTEDPLVPVESAEDIAAHIPNAELRIIPGLGHTIPVELVTEFADAITDAARAALAAAPN